MKRINTASALLAALLLCLSACTGRKTAAALDEIERCIQTRPDSALAALRALDTATLNTRPLRAYYALLYAMALDKNWIDTTDANVVMPAVAYYDRHPSENRRAMAWYYLGRIQENGGDVGSAFLSFLKAEGANRQSDRYFNALIYQSLSNIYSLSYLFGDALSYTERSLQESAAINDTAGIRVSQYRMAQDLHNLGRDPEADSIVRLLTDDPYALSFKSDLLSDYALALTNREENSSTAVQLFETVLQNSDTLRTHNHQAAYAYALLKDGRQEEAVALFERLAENDRDDEVSYKLWRARAERAMGNYSFACDLYETASDIQCANITHILNQSLLRIRQDYSEEAEAAIRSKARLRSVLSIAAVLLTAALAAGIIFAFRRRNRQMTVQCESMLETLESLSSDYDLIRKEQIAIRERYLKLCRTHFHQLGRINEMLHNIKSEKNTFLYKELRKAVHDIQADEEGQQAFEQLLNEALDDVMVHFREVFPDKKEQFYHLAGFLFAGFDAASISSLLCFYSKSNVYLQKTRLKKAIQKTDSPYKEQFLQLLR